MENNLRANFILHVITIKYIKIEFSSMLQRQMLIYSKILRDVSLATKIKQQHKIARKLLRGSVQSSMLQRQMLIYSKILRDVSLATKIKQQHKIARKLLRGSVQFSSVHFISF